MAGARGSGRRSIKKENVMHDVLHMCWDVLKNALEDEKLNKKLKIDIAMRLASRAIPQTPPVVENHQHITLVTQLHELAKEKQKDTSDARFDTSRSLHVAE